jgi:hypothetical protein
LEADRVNQIQPEVWMRLEQSRPVGEKLTARLASPGVTDRLQCGLDSQGRRHLLITLLANNESLRDVDTRGVSVVTRELTTQDQPPTRYLDIECLDASGYAAFDLLGGELAGALASNQKEPSEIVRRLLAKWRRFWGDVPKTLLSRDELVGLFAELWFLLVWLAPHLGSALAVQRWRGPFRARHDFEWKGKSIEVKATTSTRGRIHYVNGIEQLLPPENGELFVFSLRLREEAGAGNTLPSIIALCRSQFESDPEALGQFEMGLARAGHSPAHDDEYQKVVLRVVEEGLFAVRNDFPRVTPGEFVDGIPVGVESVAYEINLNTFDHLRLAKSAEEASSYLS